MKKIMIIITFALMLLLASCEDNSALYLEPIESAVVPRLEKKLAILLRKT